MRASRLSPPPPGSSPVAASAAWALISALWIGISAAAIELIWRGLAIALQHPRWADLVSAILIGLILAFFVEPVMERARAMLRRAHPAGTAESRTQQILYGAALSFVFAVISVGLHDAMLALIGGGPQRTGDAALLEGLRLTASWAAVPVAVTLAWHGIDHPRLAMPLGILAAASPVLVGIAFAWPLATMITTEVPTLAILALGYREMRRAPRRDAFLRCAWRVALVAAVWLPIALLIDIAGNDAGSFYGMEDFLVDARFYIGWALGLALVPLPSEEPSHAAGATA